MGLPPGWVTEVPGISRNDQLKLIGNGVVPLQAVAALETLLGRHEAHSADGDDRGVGTAVVADQLVQRRSDAGGDLVASTTPSPRGLLVGQFDLNIQSHESTVEQESAGTNTLEASA